MKRGILIAALLLSPLAAHAQRMSKITGGELLSICSASQFSNAKVQNCEAYLDGVADTVAGFMRFGPKDAHGKPLENEICIPPAVTAKDLRLGVIKALHQQPNLQARLAVEAVHRIFHQIYPCNGSQF